MAFVPLYAVLSDNSSARNDVHTHSLRGSVTRIGMNLNSHFGEVLNLNASSDGNLTSKANNRIRECKQKIEGYTKENQTKKVEMWNRKLIHAEEELKRLQAQEEVVVNIDLNEKLMEKTHFRVNINGIDFITLLKKNKIIKNL